MFGSGWTDCPPPHSVTYGDKCHKSSSICLTFQHFTSHLHSTGNSTWKDPPSHQPAGKCKLKLQYLLKCQWSKVKMSRLIKQSTWTTVSVFSPQHSYNHTRQKSAPRLSRETESLRSKPSRNTRAHLKIYTRIFLESKDRWVSVSWRPVWSTQPVQGLHKDILFQTNKHPPKQQQISIKNILFGAGETVQWLRALTAALIEDLGSVPKTNIAAHNYLTSVSGEGLMLSSDHHAHKAYHVHRHSCRQDTHTH